MQVLGYDSRPVGDQEADVMGNLEFEMCIRDRLKGGVIMDVMNVEQARIAEESGATSVMALERVPAMILSLIHI